MPEITVPDDFNAVVLTSPPVINQETLPKIIGLLDKTGITNMPGDRILHSHQVVEIDSAAIAGLVSAIERTHKRGDKFVICDPPPKMRSLVALYGLTTALQNFIIGSRADGTYEWEGMSFVPPFVPEKSGRVDVYTNGQVKSFRVDDKHLSDIPPVDLNTHPTKAPARANTMVLHRAESHEELQSSSLILLVKHACGCDQTHELFNRLHQLHDWYRAKGFDFINLELWASDAPAGSIVEKLMFRDHMHHGQFNTMLKIDKSWHKFEIPKKAVTDEFYYAY